MYRLFFVLLLVVSQLVADAGEDELNSVRLIISGGKDAEGGPWGKDAEEAKSYKDTKIFDEISEEHSKELLKDAAKLFNASFAGFQKYEDKAQKEREAFEKGEKYYRATDGQWRKQDDKENNERKVQRILNQGRRQAIVNLIKSMETIDKIENPSVQKNSMYLDLKASIYREYIKHQFNLKNYNQAGDMIEKYIKLSEEHEREAQPHKMLAMCYEFNQKYAARYKEKDVYEHFKNLKYEHLLRYTELSYGKDSSQYDRVLKKISRN
jgi:hypothetical protein